jgi:hypothetical protein
VAQKKGLRGAFWSYTIVARIFCIVNMRAKEVIMVFFGYAGGIVNMDHVAFVGLGSKRDSLRVTLSVHDKHAAPGILEVAGADADALLLLLYREGFNVEAFKKVFDAG